jgi:hypothetical protein
MRESGNAASSWFFPILSRRLLRRGEFASVDELVARIMAWIAEYDRTAKPFAWTYEGKPLNVACLNDPRAITTSMLFPRAALVGSGSWLLALKSSLGLGVSIE